MILKKRQELTCLRAPGSVGEEGTFPESPGSTLQELSKVPDPDEIVTWALESVISALYLLRQ